jgi:signal transduction histidine kinase/DNA-binding response OmpR family regulator/HPt (histidine-containing phosphotransfer) domain-containing protein
MYTDRRIDMRRRWTTCLSLRTKATGITVGITTVALAVVALVSILQIRSQIAAEQRRAADSVALGVARSAELPMAVHDTGELTRLASSFLRDAKVLFIVAYGADGKPMAHVVRNATAWELFLKGTIDPNRFVVGERQVEASAQNDEFSSVAESADPFSAPATHDPHKPAPRGGKLGRVVVGLSTFDAMQALARQSRIMMAVSGAAAVIGTMILLITLGAWIQRLERLATASRAISAGDFDTVIADHHEDEIGRLAQSFEGMRIALRERDRKLQNLADTLQEQVAQRTQELEKALSAAEEASRAKSLFLANMSHELRTPLNGVVGMVDLLLAANPTAQQRRYCDIAKTSARALLELINDILDFSKIEAGKLDLDATDFDLHELLEGVAVMFGERAETKGVELVCGVEANVPRMANGDPVRFRQVLSNLVSNALKFTDKGEVVVHVAVVAAHETAGTIVRCTVKDSGIGIPPDRVDRLFKSFSQVDSSTTRKFGGTGLGLAISQRIVELMGGDIGVESSEGTGSTFWFTARLGAAAQVPSRVPPATAADMRGLRVLVVDDNATNREILQAQLTSWNLQPDLAPSAEQAIRMLRDAAVSGQPYRFAVLDMHMPGTDGLELAAMIQDDPATRDVILISLSSISDRIKPRQAGRQGFAACLTKPVLPSQLYNAIVDCLSACNASPSSALPQAARSEQTSAVPQLNGVRVLLAEDNEVNRLVASELLQNVGCVCTMVVTGREALDAALRNEHDVILMDCQMPEMDGFEATAAIREAEAAAGGTIHRPIIALTANAIKGDRERCLDAGMDGYVTKPINPVELMRTIRSFVTPRADAASAQAAPATPAASPAPATASAAAKVTSTEKPVPASASPPIDLPSLEQRCMGSRKLAARLLSSFERSVNPDVQALRDSVTSGDAKSAAALAHKIKGAAANVSAEDLRRAISDLEKLAKDDTLAQTQTCLEQLDLEMLRFREYVTTAISELTTDPPAQQPLTGTTAAAGAAPVKS